MTARDARSYTGFDSELNRAGGIDYLEALVRTWMCASGVPTLYASDASDGRPIYAQWLIRSPDDWHLQNKPPHDELTDGEVMLEGAYTFVAFRGATALPTKPASRRTQPMMTAGDSDSALTMPP